MSIPKHVYMVGIGGIGMSALAQLLVVRGHVVAGSDREESPTTTLLREKGITVQIGHSAQIPEGTELLIYSDAVWPDNAERIEAKARKIPELSYFKALGIVSRSYRTLAVTGTHGKTTTTAMLAAILKAAGKSPTAIVGSIVSDFGSNFLPGDSDVLVVEACEYKDHMLELAPQVLVITNAEWDHTDYFLSLDSMLSSFSKAVSNVPKNGYVIVNNEGEHMDRVVADAKGVVSDYSTTSVPTLLLPGEFNRDNARAAKTAAQALFPDIEEVVIDDALKAFRGSWRRFEYKGETHTGAQVYDDYAHHPTAIEKTLHAAREKFPGKKIVVAFHPHLYTRTRDLKEGFVEALLHADEVIVAPIYPAREEAIPGVTNEALAEAIIAKGGNARALDFAGIRDALLEYDSNWVVFTMGAGDIYKVAEQITE